MIDVLNDPGGREKLLALGVRNVPVVAKGENYVFGQNLEDVAEFVGLQGTGHKPLPPDQLIKKWINVLRALQRYARQMPTQRIHERVIENRERSIRLLTHHAFRIGEAYLESVIDGVEYAVQHANVPPKDGTFLTGAEIAGYGEEVIGRLQKWWDGLEDKSLSRKTEDLLRHAADAHRVRALDLALRAACAAVDPRARALRHRARWAVDAPGSGRACRCRSGCSSEMGQAEIRGYTVQARSTDTFGRVLCNSRNHHFIVDGPIQNGCPGEAITPAELFLTGVAACGVELLQVIAREERLPLQAVNARDWGHARSEQPGAA